ncbi:MAG: rhomboid family intramembrane serine protease [Pirellulaceae bacterium]
MRQLAVLESETAARKLAAYLVTERIAAHAESDAAGHIIWVRDEDQLQKAKEILAHFQQSPADPRYQGAEKTAETVRREEDRRRREKASNVVEMRGRWGAGAGIRKRCPVVLAMIAASVLVAILTNGGSHAGGNAILQNLLFVDPILFTPEHIAEQPHFWSSILAGQVWRLITPIFIHYGWMHLVFNMWALFVLGGQIEDRRGSPRFLLLALVLAIASNLGESLFAQLQLPETLAMFGGMSGVVYGAFGYVWMKAKFDNSAGFTISRETVFIMMVWFALCILRDFPPFDSFLGGIMRDRVANTAHAVGLMMGVALGYAPVLIRKR